MPVAKPEPVKTEKAVAAEPVKESPKPVVQKAEAKKAAEKKAEEKKPEQKPTALSKNLFELRFHHILLLQCNLF